METGSQPSSQTSQCVEEEYVIQVPLVRPRQKFQEVLRLAGATGETFTKKEICHYLKDYISSRQLYDVNDPRIVHCGDDLLGQVFGVEKFTIDEALDLLAKNCDELPDKCVRRKRRLVIQPFSGQLSSNPRPASVTIAVCHDTSQCTGTSITTSSTLQRDVKPKRKSSSSSSSGNGNFSGRKQTADSHCHVTSSTQTKTSLLEEPLSEQSRKNKRKKHSKGGSNPESSPRKRHHTEPSSSTQCPESSRQRGTSLSITYGTDCEEDGFPWYFQVEVSDNCKDEDDQSEVLSVQGRETVTVRDSTDDLWFVDDDEVSDVEFSVEYDVESDSPDLTESDLSSVRSGEGLIVVCRESDVEFFADNSDSESNTDDRELTEADNWICQECNQSNPPFQRYCDRCWKLRSDWLPNTQSSLELSTKANQKSVHVISDGKTATEESKKINDTIDSGFGSLSSTQPSSQETVLSQNSSPRLKNLDLPVLSDFSKFQKPLIESASDQRYSFSSIQLNENGSNTVEAAKKGTLQPIVKTGSPLDDPCMICLTKTKNASLIHGSSGHQVCCFSCAKRLKRRGKVCPVCRRPIQKVVKNYIL